MMCYDALLNGNEIVLEPGQLLKLEAPRGTRIIVSHGTIWLTVTSCPDDHFLSACQSYRLRRKGLVLIEAALKGTISFSIHRDSHNPLVQKLWRTAMVTLHIQRLKARWKSLCEKLSRYATSASARR